MTAPRPRAAARAIARAAAHRVAVDGWIVVQATLGAGVAWSIATYLLEHPAPFFAPIAAIIALIANLGERGVNAIRLILGVILGLVIGDLVLITIGSGFGVMAVAVFTALAIARLVTDQPLVAVQAAFSAILVVAVGDMASGLERLVDALIGTGVALVFTQLLFPPEPISLMRRAEKSALTAVAGGLATAARAIAEDDDDLRGRAVGELRQVRDRLTELRRAGRASTNVTRRTLGWRARATVVVQENENAEHLDLLADSCLMLTRLVASAPSDTRRKVRQPVHDLADVIAALARALGDVRTRQDAANRALELASCTAALDQSADADLALLAHSLRMVATDIITFAGVDPDEATEAVREGALDQRVPPPATSSHSSHRLLGWARRLRRRSP
ncbi:fusaric acid resistance family protein [Actinomadura pelletieri DSM 43383]|uniref:Fusaric acid resistance family protein n=1 Tax=Actinomadura pelletieri DSM 43383 TaxID=1120940 RepID=A0A495QLT9_9ACTN|nr:FUSC family protein [Actinomadura pelletieri]RKS73448.1 fusaric acid resistance family protein [Actinomadura pelletieri DSM 43383]